MATYNAWNRNGLTLTGNTQRLFADFTDDGRVTMAQFIFYLEFPAWTAPELIGYIHLCNRRQDDEAPPYRKYSVMHYVPIWTPRTRVDLNVDNLARVANGINIAMFYPKKAGLAGLVGGFDFWALRMTGTSW